MGKRKRGGVCAPRYEEACGDGPLALSQAAAVPVVVHEAKNGWKAVPSRSPQAPGMLIFTAEYFHYGKRTQITKPEQLSDCSDFFI